MSDQATLWKFVFGVLVLLFCGATWLARDEPAPPSRMPVATAPGPAAARAPGLEKSAPPDVPEAQETPARISISFDEPKEARRPAAPKARKDRRRAHHHAVRRQKTRFARAANPISMPPPWACQTCLPRAEGA